MSQITLKRITSENWREAIGLSVTVEQQEFVAAVTPPAAIALAKAYIRPDGKMVEPYGVYHLQEMVGFFNLHYTPDSHEDYWLFHLFIDKRFQRMGLGSTAIQELIKHMREFHPACHRLRLTVHPENDAGKKFYKKLGFTDDHILTHGEPTFSISLKA
ncbi:GCN5 family acetyltransferase [Brevibacillus choshinensis]|uniref:GCN5 family acetyltransferase n=1 Tax=Brevibacillus choshinensis TaxID=54911 RepID=A0ABR5NAU6_BRECH|nr:GNAT family N-acetyltransferase [Brevibacillus choshinensis]KQL48506.1 GCN5 family acetyltransferase [Brevibacillus choshinensis]